MGVVVLENNSEGRSAAKCGWKVGESGVKWSVMEDRLSREQWQLADSAEVIEENRSRQALG